MGLHLSINSTEYDLADGEHIDTVKQKIFNGFGSSSISRNQLKGGNELFLRLAGVTTAVIRTSDNTVLRVR